MLPCYPPGTVGRIPRPSTVMYKNDPNISQLFCVKTSVVTKFRKFKLPLSKAFKIRAGLFMGTYILGFLCRGFQTPSRSDWRGPAGCSSETAAVWSPAGRKDGSFKQPGNVGLKKQVRPTGRLPDVPYSEASPKLTLTAFQCRAKEWLVNRNHRKTILFIWKVSSHRTASTVWNFLTWIIEHRSGLLVISQTW